MPLKFRIWNILFQCLYDWSRIISASHFFQKCVTLTYHWQRFTISYLTGRRFLLSSLLQIIRIFLLTHFCALPSTFSMLIIFYVVYISSLLCVQYWVEGNVYIFSVLTLTCCADFYSYSFSLLLALVSSCVYIWSYYYLDCEVAYKRFILLIISFIASILLLIFISNLFLGLIGWDLLGVTSFFLVIYYKNRRSLGSGIITALSNRIGDCFLFCWLGLWLAKDTALSLSILVALRLTKRAQIPFSAWLPAAIAAPTPVSALVHSSTLVTAGVYVLIRYCFLDGYLLILIGSCTILMAGVSACAESDLKKVIALSTLSQLGVIMVALGAREKSYCFFHLSTHACFKALMFICVGVCIHVSYGTQDFRSFLLLPQHVTFYWAVSVLSLMGFLFTSGFYRKDAILETLYQTTSWATLFFTLGIGLTARYSIKMLIRARLVGSLSGSCSIAYGGFGAIIKTPLTLLASFSVITGTFVSYYCGPIAIHLLPFDYLIPSFLVALGISLGYILTKFKRHTSSSIFLLVPTVQSSSSWPTIAEHQMIIDKGWLEAMVKIRPIGYSHFIGLGLITLLLFLL